ncbi:MAG TPA: gluconate:H+ symporter [Steroidobacteraceae bacterium]|nr:gluconate:H+ symporter [Steroidobacteraceae bacterium]
MTFGDARLVLAAVAGIALAIILIVRGRLHPFVALLCGAFLIGPLAGLSSADTVKAVEKGAGDILGSTGLVVALGMALGAMLQLSDGAKGLARAMIGAADAPRALWMSMLVGLLIGLPLFFETGLVLLLPIIASAATAGPKGSDLTRLRLMLSAVAGLSVVHALVPPHPGPMVAISTLNANLGRTLALGLLVAIPTAVLAGPVFARTAVRAAALTEALPAPAPLSEGVPVWRALLAVLLPVLLIVAGQVAALLPARVAAHLSLLTVASNPVLALLIACLAALPLLFGSRLRSSELQAAIWLETMRPVGTVLLAIGAGGALKQVLISTGFADLLARIATAASLSPILISWSIAVAIRLATGSATVATITAAGVMSKAVAASGVAPEWAVLAIGAGSLFFSHVNDPGFWLVKSYLGIDTATTFRTWSVVETVVSVMGLVFVVLLSHLL